MSNAVIRSSNRSAFVGIVTLLAAVVAASVVLVAQSKRDFSVAAERYSYDVSGSDNSTIRVRQDDIVRITFSAEDIPHSFTIDGYRISKRVEPGKPVVFEFRADKVGTVEFYCSLTNDGRCRRETRGRLIVTPR